MINVFAICENNCKYPTYTQEQFLALLEQILTAGSLSGIDPNLPTVEKIREVYAGKSVQFWMGTEAQFNELSLTADDYSKVVFRVGKDGRIYICTDDTTFSDFEKSIENITKNAAEAAAKVVKEQLTTEEWTFTLEDETTVTKNVYVSDGETETSGE